MWYAFDLDPKLGTCYVDRVSMIVGLGLGLGMQVTGLAAQAVLSKEDV